MPRGRRRVGWYGPALLWMVSAVGSGSVLFTPRVAARYEYELLWLALLTCLFMWIMIREAARYTTVTGRTLLDGFSRLPGPRGWALWVIFVPQLVAAVVGVAGLSALVGSAVRVAFGGSNQLYAAGVIVTSAALVATGGYDAIERLSRVFAVVLIGLSVVAAVQVLSDPGAVLSGVRPQVPADLDLGFVLPWIGTILAGSMGIVWFSYWTATRGYGGPTALSSEHHERGADDAPRQSRDGRAPANAELGTEPPRARDTGRSDPDPTAGRQALRLERIRDWLQLVSRAAVVAVVAGAIVIVSFNVLGAELLAPRGQVPSGVDVAADLGALMEGVWGRWGFWALIGLSAAALLGSVIANMDGWSRSFADITVLLRRRPLPAWLDRRRLQRAYVVGVTGVLPLAVALLVSDPVQIMTASGVVAAVHTPFIAGLILLVNRRQVPRTVQAGAVATALLGAAALYYLGVSLLRVAG